MNTGLPRLAETVLVAACTNRNVTLGVGRWRANPLRLLKMYAMPYSVSAVAVITIAWNRVAPNNSITTIKFYKKAGWIYPRFFVVKYYALSLLFSVILQLFCYTVLIRLFCYTVIIGLFCYTVIIRLDRIISAN